LLFAGKGIRLAAAKKEEGRGKREEGRDNAEYRM
jgi:hypothetical protein